MRTALNTPLTVTILDQILLSGFNLLVNLLLIHHWPPYLFGLFATTLTLGLICLSVQYALIGTQLATLRPALADTQDEQDLIATLWTANACITAVLPLVIAIGIACLWSGNGFVIGVAAGTYVAGTLSREYVRSLLFSELSPGAVLGVDVFYIAMASTGLAGLWFIGGALELSSTLFAFAFANFVSSIAIFFQRPRGFYLSLTRTTRDRYAQIWRNQSRWALLGAVMYEVVNRAHVFVVGAWFGAAAVGVLQAGEMMFRPLGLLLQAWERATMPAFARYAAAGNIAAAGSLANTGLAMLLAAGAFIMVALWGCWPWLELHVFHGEYNGITLVVALWGVSTIVRMVSQIYSVQLQGLAQFRGLGAIAIASSVTTVTLIVTLTVLSETYYYSIVAIIIGNLIGAYLAASALARINHVTRSSLSDPTHLDYASLTTTRSGRSCERRQEEKGERE